MMNPSAINTSMGGSSHSKGLPAQTVQGDIDEIGPLGTGSGQK